MVRAGASNGTATTVASARPPEVGISVHSGRRNEKLLLGRDPRRELVSVLGNHGEPGETMGL